jgi:energy-coupling factor transporter ATP-binding protein EcfA2
MGRESFHDLWKLVSAMNADGGNSQIHVYGTMGFGKSHILAALAGLLARKGKRVVYLPDCRQMVVHPLVYIQSALLCTFADPPSSAMRAKIRRLKSNDDLLAFCSSIQTPMYFIVDQMNALEAEELNEDSIPNSAKFDLVKLLQEIFLGHLVIKSASANYRTAQYTRQRQLGEEQISMMGGLSEVCVPLICARL